MLPSFNEVKEAKGSVYIKNMGESAFNILYLSDNNYAVFLGVSLTSLFENNKSIQNFIVYIIDDNIASDNKELLLSIGYKYRRELVFLDISEGIRKLKAMGAPLYRGSYTTYLKLFTFALLPESVHRILFIDTDTVVVGAVSGINDIDMQGNPVAAVMDNLAAPDKKCLGYSKHDLWFNMGVMLVDVDLWKSMNCEQIMIDTMRKRCAYVAVDQNLLNIGLHGKISVLNPSFNLTQHYQVYSYKRFTKLFPQDYFYSEETIEQAKENPVIYHFERFIGESPWHKDNVTFYSDEFDKYLAMTPWQDYEKKKADTSVILKIEKLLYKVLSHDLFLYIYASAMNMYVRSLNRKLLKGVGNISV